MSSTRNSKIFENWPLGSKVMTFQSLSHVHIPATLKLNNFANVCRGELKFCRLKVLWGICKPARFHLDRLRCCWENWVWKWPKSNFSKFEKKKNFWKFFGVGLILKPMRRPHRNRKNYPDWTWNDWDMACQSEKMVENRLFASRSSSFVSCDFVTWLVMLPRAGKAP